MHDTRGLALNVTGYGRDRSIRMEYPLRKRAQLMRAIKSFRHAVAAPGVWRTRY